MKTELEVADRQFLKQLQQLGSGTVQEIGDAIGVTATAVRQRLGRLLSLGLISRDLEKAGRGRPHHKYHLTDQGLQSLGDNYGDLALILWQEMKNIVNPAVREELMSRVRDSLVSRFGKVEPDSTLAERLEQLRVEMRARGYDMDVDQRDGLPILRENNCPFTELAGTDRDICELEQTVFERVLGVPLRLAHCCQDDHHCCEFVVGGPVVYSAE